MSKRVAIIGAGAVGGYAGAHMTAAGHDVTLIDPWPEHVDQMKSHGLEIFGMTPGERMTVQVTAMHVTEAQDLAKQRPIDIAFIAVKSYDTIWATTLIGQDLSASGCVVSMQNCINEERVAGVVGWGGRWMHRDRWRRGRPVSAGPHPPRLCETRRYHLVLCRGAERQDHQAVGGDCRASG